MIVKITSALRLDEYQWPQALPVVQSYFNSRHFESLGNHTPSDFFIPRPWKSLPIEAMFIESDNIVKATKLPIPALDIIRNTREAITKIRFDLEPTFERRERVQERSAKQSQQFDLLPGQYVLIATEGQFLSWSQLSEVIQVNSPWNIEVRVIATGQRLRKHSNQLKTFDLTYSELPLSVVEIAKFQQAQLHQIHAACDARIQRRQRGEVLEILIEFLPESLEQTTSKRWILFREAFSKVPHLVKNLLLFSTLDPAVSEKLQFAISKEVEAM
jgi:hypothetical protein